MLVVHCQPVESASWLRSALGSTPTRFRQSPVESAGLVLRKSCFRSIRVVVLEPSWTQLFGMNPHDGTSSFGHSFQFTADEECCEKPCLRSARRFQKRNAASDPILSGRKQLFLAPAPRPATSAHCLKQRTASRIEMRPDTSR